MAKPTAEELEPPLGYFNYADSYLYAAKQLVALDLKITHRLAPIYFLYHQAIELYLKAFLRLNKQTLHDIKGHKFVLLARKAAKFGMSFDDEDKLVFELLDSSDVVITARYLRVGLTTRPSMEALDRTCDSVRDLVAIRMKKDGEKIRLFPK